MSKTGDYNRLIKRRQSIASNADICPVCGRIIAARALPPPGKPRIKLIKSHACSTSCAVELRNRKAREEAKESAHV